MTREQMEAGLKAGRVLCVDRRDCKELQILLEMQREGLVKSQLVQVDDQYSVAKFTWAKDVKQT